MKRRSHSSAGGAAGSGGESFRSDVAARIAVHLLAQRAIPDLTGAAMPIRISLESAAEVDDIEVKTSNGGTWWIQAKRRVGLARGRQKPLGSAFDQFVRQYLRTTAPDPEVDKLVLAYSGAPRSIALLREVIRRFRVETLTRAEAIRSSAEAAAFRVLEAEIAASWRDTSHDCAPTWEQLSMFLKLVAFWEFPEDAEGRVDVDPAGLIEGVLADRRYATPAHNTLRTLMTTLAKARMATDARWLRTKLSEHNISLAVADGRARLIAHHLDSLCDHWDDQRPLGELSNRAEWTSALKVNHIFVTPAFMEDDTELSLADILARLRRGLSLAVLGPMGTGKSTLIMCCAAMLASAYADGIDAIPLRVHARELRAHSWPVLLGKLLPDNASLGLRARWYLLVDGIDEVGIEIWSTLARIRQRTSAIAGILAVSRPPVSPAVDDGFQILRLRPWSPTDVERFLRNWSDRDPTAVAKVRDELGATKAVDLLRTPLTATSALLIANDHSTLPRSRSGMIAGVSQFLYRQWPRSRDRSGVPWSDVQPALTELAWASVRGERLTTERVRQAFARAGYPALLDLRHEVERHLGILVQVDNGQYDFVLRAVAEHLAGEDTRKMPPTDLEPIACAAWGREVIRYAIGSIGDAGDVALAAQHLISLARHAPIAAHNIAALRAVLCAIEAAADLEFQEAPLSTEALTVLADAIVGLLLDETSIWVGKTVAESVRRLAEADGPAWSAVFQRLLPVLARSEDPATWYARACLSVEEWCTALFHREPNVRSVAIERLSSHTNRANVQVCLFMAIHDEAHAFGDLPPAVRAAMIWRTIPRQPALTEAVRRLRALVSQQHQIASGAAALALLPGEAPPGEVARALQWLSQTCPVPRNIVEALRADETYAQAIDELWPRWMEHVFTNDDRRVAGGAVSAPVRGRRVRIGPGNMRYHAIRHQAPAPSAVNRKWIARACGPRLASMDTSVLSSVANQASFVVAKELIAAGHLERALELSFESIPLDSQHELGTLLLRSAAARERVLALWPTTHGMSYPGIALEPLVDAGDPEATRVYAEWLPRSLYSSGVLSRPIPTSVITHLAVLPVACQIITNVLEQVHVGRPDGTRLAPVAAAVVLRNLAPAWQGDPRLTERVWQLAEVDAQEGLRALLIATDGVDLEADRILDLGRLVEVTLDLACPVGAPADNHRLFYAELLLEYVDRRCLVELVEPVVRRLSGLHHTISWLALAVLWPLLSLAEREAAAVRVADQSVGHRASMLPRRYLERFIATAPAAWTAAITESFERNDSLGGSIGATALMLLPRDQQLMVAVALQTSITSQRELPWQHSDELGSYARPADIVRRVLFELEVTPP